MEKEIATHSSILAWRIPWTEESGELQSWGHKELDTTGRLTHTSHAISETYLYLKKKKVIYLKFKFNCSGNLTLVPYNTPHSHKDCSPEYISTVLVLFSTLNM